MNIDTCIHFQWLLPQTWWLNKIYIFTVLKPTSLKLVLLGPKLRCHQDSAPLETPGKDVLLIYLPMIPGISWHVAMSLPSSNLFFPPSQHFLYVCQISIFLL